jgi:FimV-like protein
MRGEKPNWPPVQGGRTVEIFLSWSGNRSKAVAEALRKWLPKVIQAVDPWISLDIAKGKRWNNEISARLGKSRVGILCLTSENLEAPWLLFEAGAISKMENSRAFTFLLDVKFGDVKPPLGDFQHTRFDKEDIHKLVRSINDILPDAGAKLVPIDILDDAFNRTWPDFESELKDIPVARPTERKDVRTDSDKIDEVLDGIRAITRKIGQNNPGITSEPDEALSNTKLELAKAYAEIGDFDGAKEILVEVLAEGTKAQQNEVQRLLTGFARGRSSAIKRSRS